MNSQTRQEFFWCEQETVRSGGERGLSEMDAVRRGIGSRFPLWEWMAGCLAEGGVQIDRRNAAGFSLYSVFA